jgi:hypothetical protein
MDSVSVSRDDIDALTQGLDAGLLPAGELLRSLVNAIQAVFDGGEDSVTVSVDVTGSLRDTFDAAFTPEPGPPADPAPAPLTPAPPIPAPPAPGAQQVHLRVFKITR